MIIPVRRLLALGASTIITITASAYELRALVTDSIGEPEAFATFRIVGVPDSTRLIHGTAGEDGVVIKEVPDSGTYRFTVTAVGKQPAERTFEVGQAEPVADLGQIMLTSYGRELGEVTVTAMKPLVSREIDRIGYDVQADNDSRTSKLDEMLNRVPLVSVDPDGTIRVKGSTSFKVYKNGRPNKSMSTNAKDMFKSIPASMIKRIEVITDPGAREDAEGTEAILNIVMMENTVTKGAIGNVSLSYSTSNNYPTPGAFVSAQVDKLSLSGYYGMNTMARRWSKSCGVERAEYDQSGDVLERDSWSTNDYMGNYGGIEASYEIDTLNLITLEGNIYGHRMHSDVEQSILMSNAAGLPLYSYKQVQRVDPSKYLDLSAAVNYQRSTRRKGETITLSYMVSTTNQGSNTITDMTDIVNNPVAYTGYTNDFDLNFIEHTGQLDWKHPLWKGHVLEVGAKMIYRRNHSTNHQEYVGVGRDTVDYYHHTYVGAAYADYRFNIDRVGFRAGVRYELSHMSSDAYDDNPKYGSTLNDLCPSAAVSYNINDANSLRLSYSTSISRPGISYLNPAVVETPISVSYGNPDLGSSMRHSFNLNYSFFKQKWMIDVNTGYSFVSDGIMEMRTIDSQNITHSTYENIGRTRSFNASVYMRWNPSEKTSVMLNGFTSYSWAKNPSLGIQNSGWNGGVYVYGVQRLPWNLRVTANVNYYFFPYGGLYNHTDVSFKDNFNYGIGLQRTFLKEDRLTVSVNAYRPIWHRYTYTRSTTVNMPVNWVNEGWRRNYPVINFSVSYRFGSMNIQVKKASSSISNDDLVGRKN